MEVIVLYRERSDHAREVREYIREFTRRTGKELTTLDVDTVEGAEKAKLYDILQYPAVIAVKSDGQMLQLWQGQPLPLINDVAGYTVEQ